MLLCSDSPNARCVTFCFVLTGLTALGWVTSPLLAVPSPPLYLESPAPKAERHPSGLHSLILKEGDGARPDANDLAYVRYTGWRENGDVVTTNEDRDKPSSMRLDKVFPGWRIGLEMMQVGERRRLWIPAALGRRPKDGSRPEPTVFDVELMGFAPIPNLEREDARAPEDALRTATGASYIDLEVGEGDEEVEPWSTPLLWYTVWTAKDGKVVDTTIERGRPAAFPLERGVLAPFVDAILGMKIGGKRRIWIPGNVARGQWVGSPQGDLVFEVELRNLVELPAAELPPGS